MNRILYFSSLLLLLVSACSKTPMFPDPGLDAQMSVYDTVRRDTIDTYYYKMRVKSPNGVKLIQILDGYNYKVLEEVHSYNGQKDFEFRYALDLKNITQEDSTINRVVKVIDNDQRSYNKAFSVTVKPFSKPTVHMQGVDGVLGLENTNFELSALFETGLNFLKSYKVDFEGVVLDQGVFNGALHQYAYVKVMDLAMQKNREYTLSVTLTDDKNNVGTKQVKVRLIDIKRPLKVFINSYSSGSPRLNQEWEFFYNPSDPKRLDSISTLLYSNVLVNGVSTLRIKEGNYKMSYNNAGNVTMIERWSLEGKLWELEAQWTYAYDSQQRLERVTSNSASKYDIRVSGWHPDGRVMRMGNVPDWPVTDLIPWYTHSSGLLLNAEMRMISNKRSISTKVSNVVIPTYQQGLPPFLPYNSSHEDFQILTMWKYGVEWVHEYNAAKGNDFLKYQNDHPKLEYSYSTNVTGRLSKIVKKTVSTKGDRTPSREWNFIYD